MCEFNSSQFLARQLLKAEVQSEKKGIDLDGGKPKEGGCCS